MQINRAITFWSVGRIVYGVASIVVAAYSDWTHHASTWQFAIGLVSIAMLAEILPFMYAPVIDTTSGIATALRKSRDDDIIGDNELYEPLTGGNIAVAAPIPTKRSVHTSFEIK